MKRFPAFLDVAERPCLVAGGGRVGLEKARSLSAAGARVLVLDPLPTPQLLSECAADAHLAVEARAFRDEDCRGRFLVFACTGVEEVDEAVAMAARRHGALCCRAGGGEGDFTTGATLVRGDVCVAVSSAGASPALAAEVRDRIADVVGAEFAEAARLLGELRGRLRAGVADRSARAKALGSAVVKDVLAALRGGRPDQAKAVVEEAFARARRSSASGEGSCTR